MSGCVVSGGVLGVRCAALCGVLRCGVALGPVWAVCGRVWGCSVRVGVVGVRFGFRVVVPALCWVLCRCVLACRCGRVRVGGVWVRFAFCLVAFCLLVWSR